MTGPQGVGHFMGAIDVSHFTDLETFKEKVGFMSVRQLSRIAKERGAGSLGYAEAMLVAYNRKCRYTLRMTKLHSGAITAEDDFIEENEDPLADAPVFEK